MKKSKIIINSFLIGLLVVSGAHIISSATNISYSQVEALEGEFVSSSELPATYSLGSEFFIPNGKISYNGTTYAYDDYYLTYPNGKSYKQESYKLDIAGKYDLTLISQLSNSKLYSHYEFYTLNGAYTVTNDNSYVQFVDEIPTSDQHLPGLSINLAENDTFTFNQTIDISDASLDEPLLVYYPHAQTVRANPANAHLDLTQMFDSTDPNKPKAAPIDANGSIVRITDAYDPTNYFEVVIFYRCANASNNRMQQYCVAGTSTQTLIGLEPGSVVGAADRLINIDGQSYRVFSGLSTDSFGRTLNTRTGNIFELRDGVKRPIGTTLNPGTTADISNADDFGFSVYFDSATKKIYVKHVTTQYVTDLDDPTVYGSNLFKPFTTGEAYVSITGFEYKDSAAKYDVSHIKGVSSLNMNNVIDTKAPDVTLSNQNNDFYIAVNEPFELFDAEVVDVNYQGDLEKIAYYEYGTNQQVQFPIIDNKLTPTKPGSYTVIYRASDTFGNVNETQLNLYAVTTETGHIIDFNVDHVSDLEAGQEITLPTPYIRVYNNEPQIKAYATFEDGSVTNINTTSWKLFLKQVGTYEITYVYGDGILEYEYSYSFTTKTSSNFYLEEVRLPKYIIREAAYTFDSARVVKVASKELAYDEPKIYVIEDGVDNNKLINRKNFSTEANTSVQFKYVYDNVVLYTSEVIPVQNVDFKTKLNKMSYFATENFEVSGTSSAIKLTTNTSVGDASAEFINPLNFSSFAIKFDLRGSDLNAAKLEIILEDYMDENNKYVFSIYSKSDSYYISCNGGIEFTISKATYTLTYNPITKVMSDTFENSYEMENPFETDRFYLSLRYVGLEGISSISVNSIDGQPMNQAFYDTKGGNVVAPSIENTRAINTVIPLDFFFPEDVFSPYLEENFEISVVYYETEDSEGEYAYADDGTLLDGTQENIKHRTFTLTKVGCYQVFYNYYDQTYANGKLNSRVGSDVKSIYSVDDTPPTIIINNGYNESTIVQVKVGSTHKVQGYKVIDDLDENVEVTKYVMDPNLVHTKLTGNSFKCKVAGDYRVYYYAKDSNGNISTVYYTVRAI